MAFPEYVLDGVRQLDLDRHIQPGERISAWATTVQAFASVCQRRQRPRRWQGLSAQHGHHQLGGFPSVVISGFGQTQLGSRRGRPLESGPNPYYDFQDNVSYLRGKHAFKFGVEYAHIEGGNSTATTRGAGSISRVANVTTGLSPVFPRHWKTFSPDFRTDGSLLVGNPAITTICHEYGVFVQDDWRIVPKIMLNLGMRWEYRSPIARSTTCSGNFDPTLGMVQQGQASVGNTLWKPDYKNWSPRVGFAWDVTGKGTTVIRGGAGVFSTRCSAWPRSRGTPGSRTHRARASPRSRRAPARRAVAAGDPLSDRPLAARLRPAPPICRLPPSTGMALFFRRAPRVSCTAAAPCSLGSVDPHLKTP